MPLMFFALGIPAVLSALFATVIVCMGELPDAR